MEKHLEQRIRERAYEIWEGEGRSGNLEDHWSRAEQDLNNAGALGGKMLPERKPLTTRSSINLAISRKC